MIKRNITPQASPLQKNVRLVTQHEGEEMHFAEPSVACAARHAINVCDNEEGCAQSIEVDGRIVWHFDPEHPRRSLEALDELAQGECVR
jgi:hypothetical protein